MRMMSQSSHPHQDAIVSLAGVESGKGLPLRGKQEFQRAGKLGYFFKGYDLLFLYTQFDELGGPRVRRKHLKRSCRITQQ